MHYLNNFRGEPAISEFDWPFTPNHCSSQHIATCTGSVKNLTMIRSFSFGYNINYLCLLKLAFTVPLSLQFILSRWPIIQKVRNHKKICSYW